jgi:hypothetical protein
MLLLFAPARAHSQVPDQVVPRAQSGSNFYCNLVSCCLNATQKGERPAEDFLRWLYRERRLTAAELTGRVRALSPGLGQATARGSGSREYEQGSSEVSRK